MLAPVCDDASETLVVQTKSCCMFPDMPSTNMSSLPRSHTHTHTLSLNRWPRCNQEHDYLECFAAVFQRLRTSQLLLLSSTSQRALGGLNMHESGSHVNWNIWNYVKKKTVKSLSVGTERGRCAMLATSRLFYFRAGGQSWSAVIQSHDESSWNSKFFSFFLFYDQILKASRYIEQWVRVK